MKYPKSPKATATSKQVDASIKSVDQVTQAFGTFQRLTPKERKATLKLRRGAHQVIPQITAMAAKYGYTTPAISSDTVNASLESAQTLEPLLKSTAVLHATLIDAHLASQRAAWKGATALYGMIRNAANADPNIATELQPVKAWFKRRPKATVAPAAPTATPAATQPATSATAPVTAQVASPANAVTTSAPAPVTTAASTTPSPTPSPVATSAAPAVAPTTAP
jgi:hypothetical protein